MTSHSNKKMTGEKKENLADVTFLFPIRLDSIDRLENLIEVVNFINAHFTTNIHVLEASSYCNGLLERLLPEITYTYHQDDDPVFHRTRYINEMLKASSTKIVAVWDSDVLVKPEQIIQSVDLLRNKKADFVFPYDGKFLDTSKIVRELYMEKKLLKLLVENAGKMQALYEPKPVGGGYFADRESYIASGMENESYYGWGLEDGERVNRWKVLEYKVERVKGDMYHLTHERKYNSTPQSPIQHELKRSMQLHLVRMSKEEMQKEISTWN